MGLHGGRSEVEGYGRDMDEEWLLQLASDNNRLEEDCEAMEAIDYADGTYTDPP